ncbi:phage portal protein [Paenibacillus sp. LC231]|nr:phage portal protein [Paenibacillus sp. LC231]
MRLDNAKKTQEILNQGYGNHGASRTKKSLKAFNPRAGSADEDIHANLGVLRARSRDEFMGNPLANGAIKTKKTNVIGVGLVPKPNPDVEALGLNPDQAKTLKNQIKREWDLWAESKYADAAGLSNFYGLQQLAFQSALISGDVLALLNDIEEKHSVYDLRVKLVEADLCTSPTAQEDTKDRDIKNGVETDKNGRVVAYWFANKYPNGFNLVTTKHTRVPVIGDESGRRFVIHLLEMERPGQRRGVPVLAPVIESLKMLGRYTEAELMAAVISSMFTVFVKKKADTDEDDFGINVTDPTTGAEIQPEPGEVNMGSGAVQFLEEGEDISVANPGRQNTAFDPFVMSILRQIGSSLEIPYELLIKHFTSSYSASRAALLEAWKMFKTLRKWMGDNFCQPIYEEWFTEAVTKGRIQAPGIFNDPAIFRAYTRCAWHGPGQGLINPVQEVTASEKKIALGISTREIEAAEQNGTDFEDNAQQLIYERGLVEQFTPGMAATSANDSGGEGGDDEDAQTN